MRASHLLPLLVVLGLTAIGCEQQKAPHAGKSTETKTDAASADSDDSSLDSAKKLIASINETNEHRKDDNQDSTNANEAIDSAQRVLAAGSELQGLDSVKVRQLEGYNQAIGVWLLYRTVLVKPDDVNDLYTEIKSFLTSTPSPPLEAAQAAVLIADQFADEGGERTIEVCQALGPLLAKSDNDQIRSYSDRLAGVARGLNLMGKPLEISGTTVEGKPFNLTELRGKVVLVDFWTTWCGPCRAEAPNVKKNYELYHDRGFDVVSISLDDQREALDDFLKEDPAPWITLYDGPWSDSHNAIYYGVSGVPTVILVDKEGKVVSASARGPELGKQLAALLGPAEAASDPGEEKKE